MRVTLGDYTQRTQTCKDAGIYPPVWDRVLDPPIPVHQLSDEVVIELFDEDLKRATLIGETTVKAGILNHRHTKTFCLTLSYKGEDMGEILIEAKMMTTQ